VSASPIILGQRLSGPESVVRYWRGLDGSSEAACSWSVSPGASAGRCESSPAAAGARAGEAEVFSLESRLDFIIHKMGSQLQIPAPAASPPLFCVPLSQVPARRSAVRNEQ